MLEIIESDELKFESEGLAIPGAVEDNLILKAYNLIKKDHDIPPVHIFLYKNIPMGAGLGGGSADAAFMLKLLNSKFSIGLSDDALKNYAAQLGSDCAFFIDNTPAFAKGRGEELEQVEVDLQGFYIAVVFPQITLNTGWAFQQITPNKAPVNLKEVIQHAPETWQKYISNDFELPVFKAHPKISHIKKGMLEAGAAYASMSGSGSAVYGIFEEKPQIDFPDYKTFISPL